MIQDFNFIKLIYNMLHNFLRFLQQAFRSEETEKSEIRSRSILAQMLPEAMVAYLENHGPEKFAQVCVCTTVRN